jgi:hypothetical protein
VRVYAAQCEPRFGSDLEQFRRYNFRVPWNGGSSEDSFDSGASHLSIRCEGRLVSAVRLLRDKSFASSWAPNLPSVHGNKRTVEVSRLVGHREFGQAWACAHLIGCEALLFSAFIGAEAVVATKDADDPMLPFLFSLGFRQIGPTFSAIVPPRVESAECVLFSLDLPDVLPRVFAVRAYCIAVLERHSSTYTSEIPRPEWLAEVNVRLEIDRWLKDRVREKKTFRSTIPSTRHSP